MFPCGAVVVNSRSLCANRPDAYSNDLSLFSLTLQFETELMRFGSAYTRLIMQLCG